MSFATVCYISKKMFSNLGLFNNNEYIKMKFIYIKSCKIYKNYVTKLAFPRNTMSTLLEDFLIVE